jgi:hypothetical protein
MYYLIGLEQEGEQIECDFIIFKIRCQTGFGRYISSLNILYQKIEMLGFRILASFVFKLFSICF